MPDAKPVTLQLPAGGEKITIADGKLHVPDQPIIPFIEGDGTGPRHLARERAGVRCGRAKAYGGKRKIHWMEVFAGEKANKALQHLAARRNRRRLPRLPGLDQGTADDAGRRRHPLAQRGAAAIAGPVRLPAAGALVQGRALARAGAGEGRHGDLPREHRGHLRGHRVRGGLRRLQEVPRAVQAELSRNNTPRSASRRARASASSPPRRRAPSGCSARPSSTRSPTSARA